MTAARIDRVLPRLSVTKPRQIFDDGEERANAVRASGVVWHGEFR